MKDLPDKANLRPDEVAEFFDVSTKTVYRLYEEGKLKGFRLSKRIIRITRDSVLELRNKEGV